MDKCMNKELSKMEKDKIEKKSSELLKKFAYEDGAVDVVKLAKYLGFYVGMSPLTDEEDGFIIVDESMETIENVFGIKTDKIIGVNSERPLKDKRFILAHEIGHYYLQYDKEVNQGMFASREHKKGKNETENEIDFFAACLLMPANHFKKKYDEFKVRLVTEEAIIRDLAEYFLANEDSVRRRIVEVNA